MLQLLSKFLRDQAGATAIEYCLIAAGLSIVIITAVNSIGTSLNTKITSVSSSLQ
jgi:pilus assembly protein Flp/PilA